MPDLSDPFIVYPEADGSVCVLVRPFREAGSPGPDDDVVSHYVGHVMPASDGGFLFSPTYEENENTYSEWDRSLDLKGAVMSLVLNKAESSGDPDGKYALGVALGLGPSYVHRVREGLVRAAKSALTRAVRNMLLVAPHEDVLSAFSEAVAASVMEG